MKRIVIINESTFVKWTKSVERLQKLLESQEQQVSNRKTTEWIGTDEVCRMLGIGKRTVHAMRECGELQSFPMCCLAERYSIVRVTCKASYSETMCQHPDISIDDAGNGNSE